MNEQPLKRKLSEGQQKVLGWIYHDLAKYDMAMLSDKEQALLKQARYSVRMQKLPVPIRPPTSSYPRLGQFYHVVLKLTQEVTLHELSDDTIKELKKAIDDMFFCRFAKQGKYQIGYFIRPENQVTSDIHPANHFHVLLARIRFPVIIKPLAKDFKFTWSAKKRKKYFQGFFCGPHITLVPKNKLSLEKVWRKKQETILGMTKLIDEQGTLFWYRGKRSAQVEADRLANAFYLNNAGLKPFRHDRIKLRYNPDKGLVYVCQQENNPPPYSHQAEICHSTTTTMAMTRIDFFRRYIFTANQRPGGIISQPRGYLSGGSHFSSVIDYALTQEVCIEHPYPVMVPFLERPVQIIQKEAKLCLLPSAENI